MGEITPCLTRRNAPLSKILKRGINVIRLSFPNQIYLFTIDVI